MTREILFRAKRIDNGEWVEGHYVNCFFRTANSDVRDVRTGHFVVEYPEKYHEIYTDTICQYTAAIDIEGKRIWENDFVENDGAIGIVKFGKYGNGFHLGFYINWINCPHLRNEICFWESNVRVIGNVFDNPEIAEEITEESD